MSIYINGRRLVKEPEIKTGLVDAFQSLLYDLNNWCPPFPNLSFNSISIEQATKLEEMFIKEEIRRNVYRGGNPSSGLWDQRR